VSSKFCLLPKRTSCDTHTLGSITTTFISLITSHYRRITDQASENFSPSSISSDICAFIGKKTRFRKKLSLGCLGATVISLYPTFEEKDVFGIFWQTYFYSPSQVSFRTCFFWDSTALLLMFSMRAYVWRLYLNFDFQTKMKLKHKEIQEKLAKLKELPTSQQFSVSHFCRGRMLTKHSCWASAKSFGSRHQYVNCHIHLIPFL
jgi:hypothetical protein